MIYRTKPRQGITLLFVVSMIVLFLLMGTAFVIVANDFFRASKDRSLRAVHKIDNTQLLERAFYELVRGPSLSNTTSPLRCSDLLSDQYGYGFKAYVAQNPAPAFLPGSNDQFIVFALSSDPTLANADSQAIELRDVAAGALPLAEVPSFYNGTVISFVNGQAKGVSTRIVAHDIDNTTTPPTHYFTVPALAWTDGGNLATAADLANLATSEVIVNNQDFAGIGPATNGSGVVGAAASQPNRVGETEANLRANYLTTSLATNEPWDAADMYNVFLSGVDGDGNPVNSFHRPRLSGARGTFAAFPSAANPITVDSDFNGIADSLWMDIGFPVQSNNQGVYFKPLVAYHVVDLDGRLNLNAAGNLTQVDPNNFISTAVTPAGAASTMPSGEGWGPPEIQLEQALQNSQGFTAEAVLSTILSLRYGPDGVPGDGGASGRGRAKLFGHPFDTVNWGSNRHGTIGNLFASSAMNLHGRFRIVTPMTARYNGSAKDRFVDPNYAGLTMADPNYMPNAMPVIDMLDSSMGGVEFLNSPYEMSFASLPYGDANDAPFSALELERLLRPYDLDSQSLPDRLWNMLGATNAEAFWVNDGNIPFRNQIVTTDSYNVPTTYSSIVTLVYRRIARELGVNLSSATQVQRDQVRNLTENLLRRIGGDYCIAPELVQRLKMNVNRPFGDGYDSADASNDGPDGVVDDPGEEPFETNTDQGGVPMDLNNDGVANNAADVDARIEFARQLYTLSLLLSEPIDYDANGRVDATDELEHARVLAQWSINVVEYRDPDSIMTLFKYDPNPFDNNGWNPTDSVWGCERPELLISETIAAHARRTEDLAAGGGDQTSGSDDDYDQRLRPEAFAFIELYNPWTQNSHNQIFDSSLYNQAAQGVDLARVNQETSSALGSPVWRLAIVRPQRTANDGSNINESVKRYVYFTDPDATGVAPVTDDESANVEVYFPSTATAAPLRPGAHAVIGTRGFEDPSNAGEFVNYFGRLNSKTAGDETAGSLDLNMTNQLRTIPGSGQVSRFPADEKGIDPRSASVLLIDQARPGNAPGTGTDRKFSVSDPFGGYPTTDAMGNPITDIVDGDGAFYQNIFDQPLDLIPDFNRDASDLLAIQLQDTSPQDGMAKNFRVVRLQRLADPLRAWNGTTNPYITVDTMEMDLIAFNGVTDNTGEAFTSISGPNVAPPSAVNDRAVSLERGNGDSSGIDRRQLFGHRRDSAIRTPTTVPAGDHYFNAVHDETFGKTNDAYVDSLTGDSSPSLPYAWLSWNNRPFSSHTEVANVPFLSSEELTFTPETTPIKRSFTVDDDTLLDPYANLRTDGTFNTYGGRYGHLLNFYATDAPGNGMPNLHRILDYLEVPSRFVGTDSLLSVSSVAQNPFNRLSRYRTPGTININTIPNEAVWNSLMGEFANVVPFSEIQNSIRDGNSAPGAGVPTDFPNPFRPAEAADIMPPSVAAVDGANATLFRSDLTGNSPLFDFDSTNETHPSRRSAYFRNAMRQRLGNLVTTKSSVFAIWITVGFFEVDPTTGDLLPGTGNRGVEVGADTGEARRHRAFYIFDRSIPVAFEPGKNHNIERAVLVKSIIE